jgi:VanZ family protein
VILRFTIFFAFLGLWTWKLLEPNPVPEDLHEGLEQAGLSFAVAKCLHATGYAFLTALAFTLPVRRRWNWIFVGFLVLHGAGTEIGQTFVPNRTGRVRDVLIDWFGIGLGLLAVFVWKKARTSGPK